MPTPSPHPIPFIYRLCFLYIEPFLALGGVCQVLFAPTSYTVISHPTLHAALVLHPHLTSPLQTLFTCIAGGWLMFAVNDLVTLRVFQRQPKVWRCVMCAHLCSDLLYVLALAQDVGFGHAVDVRVWSREEWFTQVLTLPFLVAKVAVLLGVGIDFGEGEGEVVEVSKGKGKRA